MLVGQLSRGPASSSSTSAGCSSCSEVSQGSQSQQAVQAVEVRRGASDWPGKGGRWITAACTRRQWREK